VDVSQNDARRRPLVTLYNNMLDALAENPQNIYREESRGHSPFDEFCNLVTNPRGGSVHRPAETAQPDASVDGGKTDGEP
jgi:hypothetical protein